MRWILIVAAILGATSVILGAALKHAVTTSEFDTLQTALRYHQIHSLALLALGLYALDKTRDLALSLCAILFTIGVIVFSGGLYVMVLYGMPELGKLTPVGGVALILGWLSLIFVKNQNN